MKYFKLSLVVASLALFALACGETSTNTNQTANATQPVNTASANNGSANTGAANTGTANTSAAPADEMAAARTTYMQVCTNCHGDKADGGTVNLEGKKLKVPSLKEGHVLNHTDDQLARKIAQGGDGMPSFKDRLKPEQINALVRLIRKEFQGGASSSSSSSSTATKAPAPKS